MLACIEPLINTLPFFCRYLYFNFQLQSWHWRCCLFTILVILHFLETLLLLAYLYHLSCTCTYMPGCIPNAKQVQGSKIKGILWYRIWILGYFSKRTSKSHITGQLTYSGVLPLRTKTLNANYLTFYNL